MELETNSKFIEWLKTKDRGRLLAKQLVRQLLRSASNDCNFIFIGSTLAALFYSIANPQKSPYEALLRNISKMNRPKRPSGASTEERPPGADDGRPERMNDMKEYKEIRRISACSLRQLCVDKDWYTAGDNDEYGHLLYDLANDKENLTTADIIEIAADIMAHSDLDDDYTIESIAFEVTRIANVFFKEA